MLFGERALHCCRGGALCCQQHERAACLLPLLLLLLSRLLTKQCWVWCRVAALTALLLMWHLEKLKRQSL